ncbi:MAG TPA: hypothetical protein VMX38_14965 [Verrucomicrobiae bacterium]|jgi:hypothetical protein|nr:hypothetical protein [Verrucomicrobiae bacterium]
MRSTTLLRSVAVAVAISICIPAQAQTQSSSSVGKSPPTHANEHDAAADLDAGSVSRGVYRNKAFGFSCKVPEQWVLRTDEMNARDDSPSSVPAKGAGSARSAKVLLAAFSRPPDARGEDVNDSIVIAAESVSAYPGLTEAAQYFGPLTEVAKSQDFIVDDDPYEVEIEKKLLVRGDFHKDVGTRVMHQSTLAFLSHGYAVSITVIGGTDDEVEDLIDGLDFATAESAPARK